MVFSIFTSLNGLDAERTIAIASPHFIYTGLAWNSSGILWECCVGSTGATTIVHELGDKIVCIRDLLLCSTGDLIDVLEIRLCRRGPATVLRLNQCKMSVDPIAPQRSHAPICNAIHWWWTLQGFPSALSPVSLLRGLSPVVVVKELAHPLNALRGAGPLWFDNRVLEIGEGAKSLEMSTDVPLMHVRLRKRMHLH